MWKQSEPANRFKKYLKRTQDLYNNFKPIPRDKDLGRRW